jgi:hypothetical protein
MGQHRRHGGNRAGGATMGQLPIHLGGNGPLLNLDDHIGRAIEGRNLDIDVFDPEFRGPKLDAVFRDPVAAFPHLIDQTKKRASKRHQIPQVSAP